MVEGKMDKSLKKILKRVVVKDMQEQLAVADSKLGSVIKVSVKSVVVLAIEEMRTLYMTGQEICVQKFGNGIPTK